MKFDDVFIDQIRSSVSIVGLINGYIPLKKSGKDYSALCPFHHEKTPSFMVSESKQIFKCFGCGTGGDVFKFIMLMENLSFPESIHYLAERHGISLPQQGSHNQADRQERQRLFEIMETTSRFFQRSLQRVDHALDYLLDRQIENETIEKFHIGYAPPGSRLLDELQRQGFKIEEISVCGLVREGDSGQSYDRFRNRVMFPIPDLSGRTIAFGGRILGEGVPKYLNSPDTVLYKKSNNLYPLNVTRNEIRRRDFAILVEGYFDCLVPFQFGVRNIVASLGTSLTENQVQVLGRHTRNVLINYDPDSAGTAAAMRSVDLFLEKGFRVNVLQLPKEADPDTFLRSEGREAYLEKVKSSQPYLEFVLSRFIGQQKDPSSPKGKQEIISQILPYLAKIPSQIERAEYVSRVASRLRIDENLLLMEMRKIARARQFAPRLRLPGLIDQVTPAENALLAALMEEEWSALTLKQLEPALFEGLSTERIFGAVVQLEGEGRAISTVNLRDVVAEQDQDLVETFAVGSSKVLLSEEIIKNSVLALRKKQYERLSLQVQEEINSTEKEPSKSGRMDELLVEKERILRKIKQLELA